jgi:ComF family protein
MYNFMDYVFHKLIAFLFPTVAAIQAIEAMDMQTFNAHAHRVLDELPPGIYSIYKYKDSFVRRALWAVKYDGNRTIARLFAALLYEHMLEIIFEATLFNNFTDPIIIPVPLSKERRKERGWNQAELIAKELIKLYPQSELRTDILLKIKHTAPQTKLSRDERLKNLRGCFWIPEHQVAFLKNKNIILIDDVVTTGSTIIECRRTLLESGVRQVLAFTIAH